ncbi:MAG: glycosyltransferase, partial [Rubrivivax sp.]|nr:glycosyltransferase [Rubrivivax sp.]
AAAGRRLGIPLVVSPRGMLQPWAWRHHRWRKMLAWRLYQGRDLASAAAFCAASEAEAEAIRHCGFGQPIGIVPNGVAIPHLAPRHEPGHGEKTALFLSRIHPSKGPCLLVEAWSEAKPAGWNVVVAGPDEDGHRREVEQLVKERGLSEVFTFAGPVESEEKSRLLARSDLVILPTQSENFGLVVAEALAHAVPVITTTRAPWRGLREHECGWWVEPDARDIAEAIRAATSMSDEERRAMGSRGRAWMTRSFSWAEAADRLLAFYQWILHGGGAPCCLFDGKGRGRDRG